MFFSIHVGIYISSFQRLFVESICILIRKLFINLLMPSRNEYSLQAQWHFIKQEASLYYNRNSFCKALLWLNGEHLRWSYLAFIDCDFFIFTFDYRIDILLRHIMCWKNIYIIIYTEEILYCLCNGDHSLFTKSEFSSFVQV